MSNTSKTSVKPSGDIIAVTIEEKDGFFGKYKEATVVDAHGHKTKGWEYSSSSAADATATQHAIQKLPCR